MVVEPTHGGRNKKLIWALESYERHGRPSCSECGDRLRKQRGCAKPGMEKVEGSSCFRFTSPWLKDGDPMSPEGPLRDGDRLLRECPLSVVLRNAPHVFSAIPLHGMVYESGSVDWFNLSPWAQSAVRVIGSERSRLRELERREKDSIRNSQIGIDVRRGSR